MTELIYCVNACTRKHGDEWQPVTTEPPSQLCARCEDRLKQWITTIPEKYALLPIFLEHGAAERNPDSKATKSATAQAPMRLDIVDLLDTRRGRHWNGTEPTTDRRGVAGILKVHIDRLIEERPLTQQSPITTISEACNLLDRHLLWLVEQDWVEYLYEDIRQLIRTLADAVGEYRQKPVGRCHLEPEGSDVACGGPLFANTYGGVRCARCNASWEADKLRLLGLAQAGVTIEESA